MILIRTSMVMIRGYRSVSSGTAFLFARSFRDHSIASVRSNRLHNGWLLEDWLLEEQRLI